MEKNQREGQIRKLSPQTIGGGRKQNEACAWEK